MPLEGWDHIELWVGNAKQAAYYYEHAMGFTRTAYAGPETGVRDRASYVLEQGDIRFVVTSALHEDHEITRHHAKHGDGVRDIALTVPDATEAYRQAVDRGARGVSEPHRDEDQFGSVERAAIATYGDTIHTFVNRSDYAGPFMPGYVSVSANGHTQQGVGLTNIDHVVGNVELGKMNVLGRVLRARLRDDEHHPLRRRPDPHRVLGVDVEGDVGRLGEDQVPDQRARGGQAEEPDRGVRRVLRRPGRAAHRTREQRHRRHRRAR